MKPRGYFALFLHSHIPYTLHHGTWPHGMDWLYEAHAECYNPLADVFESIQRDGVPFEVTLSLSAVLLEQLNHPDYRPAFLRYLEERVEAAREDRNAFEKTGLTRRIPLTRFWESFYEAQETRHETFWERLLALKGQGRLELATTPATHPYLPLIGRDESIALQVERGKTAFTRYGGGDLRGMWLPECGYRPAGAWRPPGDPDNWGTVQRRGVDSFLVDAGVDYFLVDHHLTAGGKPLGTYMARFPLLKRLWKEAQARQPYRPRKISPYYPYATEGGAAFFTRDPETTHQVWARDGGYPGTGEYLEFHKKHFPGGMRYWSVTHPGADLADKRPYNPDAARERIREQAEHFVSILEGIVEREAEPDGPPPVIVAPYDSELFGHWWFEGPLWIGEVLRRIAASPTIDSISLANYLDRYPPGEVVALPEGSWGEGGFHWVWLNQETQWVWKEIYGAEEAFWREDPARSTPYLDQATIELLLLQSSDWPFLITTWSARDYAENRAAFHAEAFNRMLDLHHRALEGQTTPEGEEYLHTLQGYEGDIFK